jgi:polar amino acid transport system substrate-binding protein
LLTSLSLRNSVSLPFNGAITRRVQHTGELRWGADDIGGAPYVFQDTSDPNKMVGFEVEVMEAIGRELHVRPVLVLTPWEQLVPALERNNFDMAFNGLEVTPERSKEILFGHPYYYFSEQITSRRGDSRFQRFEDLRGHRVGTLTASLAYTLLANDPRVTTVPYPSPVESYSDLELGRLDAVLMDVPIAAWYAGPNSKLQNTGPPLAEGTYAAGFRKDSPELQQKIDQAIVTLVRSGELEMIYKRWNIWTPAQRKLKKRAASPDAVQRQEGLWRFAPLFLQGALMTIFISILSMGIAVLFGGLLCLGKLYGGGVVKGLSGAYIEVIRGTPLLVQLYLLYYGLPNIGIELNAVVAAVLGMGLNYAAYEAEIYRAGLLSVSRGQWEAARSLGMTPGQALRYIIGPQASRTVLPPSTNDFIALFKDTSIVSVLTVTELTKVYSTAATATYRFLELGLITAALYFAMSYPLSLWSRSLERKRHATVH